MKKALEFLRLIDSHDGQLSLTNVALMVVLVKIGMAQEVSIVDAGALFVTLLSYQGKKVINKGAATNDDIEGIKSRLDDDVKGISEKLSEMESRVSAQQIALGVKDLRR